jgi:hypothetical protein
MCYDAWSFLLENNCGSRFKSCPMNVFIWWDFISFTLKIWEIFRKSQKISNLPFLSERLEKLSSWCLAQLASSKSRSILQNCFIWMQLQILVINFSNLKICHEFRDFFRLFLLVGPSPDQLLKRELKQGKSPRQMNEQKTHLNIHKPPSPSPPPS